MVDVKMRGTESEVTLSRMRNIVKLYFIDVQYVKDYPKYTTHAFYTRGRAFRLPALGEYVEVPEVLALDLIDKTRFKGRNILVTEAEGGAQMAALIKEALAAGQPLETLDLRKAYTAKALDTISNDELLQMLKQRGIALPTETQALEIQVSELKDVKVNNMPASMKAKNG